MGNYSYSISSPVIQKMTRDLDSLVAIGGLAANEELLSLHKVSRGNYELVLGEQGFPLGNMNREPSTVRIFPGKSNTSLVVVEIPFGAPRLHSELPGQNGTLDCHLEFRPKVRGVQAYGGCSMYAIALWIQQNSGLTHKRIGQIDSSPSCPSINWNVNVLASNRSVSTPVRGFTGIYYDARKLIFVKETFV